MLLEKIEHVYKNIKNTKISIKLTIVYAFMFSLVLILLNASILFGVRYYFYNQANKQIEDMQTIISNKIVLEKDGSDLSSKEFFSDVPSKENIFIRIAKKDGSIINSSEGFDFNPNIPWNNIDKPRNGTNHLEDKEKHLLYKNVPFLSKEYNTIYVQIVKDMHNEYDFMKILFWFMAIADFIGIIVSVVVGQMVSKRMLKPIDSITKAAENISISNLKERITTSNGADDELKRLANTFNKMIDRLQDAFDKQVQFVSDASHELRTPIAVIQGYANLLDRWGKNDKDALEKSIYSIKLEAANMANMVEKLLFIAKGDIGTQRIEKSKFNLNNLIFDVIEDSKLIAQNHIITSTKNVEVCLFADFNMIKQMLRVFIENSIKFSPEKTIIDISSEIQGEEVKITVSDSGIGIPKNEIENVFDRFYTIDKSRSKENSGTGLGLSIAKWIADIHNGKIQIESEEGMYTKVIVYLKIKK